MAGYLLYYNHKEQIKQPRKETVNSMTIKTEYGNITASKELLNLITGYLFEASDRYSKKERPALSEQSLKLANTIFNKLDETGYYN